MHGAKDHFDPTPPPLRLVGGPDDYDALAELFLGDEPRASRRVGVSTDADAIESRRHPASVQTEAEPPGPQVVVRPQQKSRTSSTEPQHRRALLIEALILGHLPVRSFPWISQYARVRAESLGRSVALLRVQDDHLWLEVFGASESNSPMTDLRAAIAHARSLTSDWIIQVDEINELSLAADDRLSAVTLLTSAHETAVIAAYRAIKGFASARNESRAIDAGNEHDLDVEGPHLRVGIMGATTSEAEAAMARLRKACSVFLGRPLELAASVERIGPATASGLYFGPVTMELPEILETITSPEPASRPAPTAESTSAASPDATNDSDAQELHSLALHVPGLQLLAARCPDDHAIELAIDAQGRLHLLRRADEPDACQRLVAAAAWAMRHVELLALTMPHGILFDGNLSPTAHLFTAEPKAFRRLLDSDVHLHLLAQSAPNAPWICVELN